MQTGRLEALLNGAWIFARLQAADHIVTADQAFAEREIDFSGIEFCRAMASSKRASSNQKAPGS